MPIDFEIFLGDDNYRLYSDKDTQKEYFEQIVPVANFIEQIFRSRGMPYLLDYTPSGGHFLFQNQFGDRATTNGYLGPRTYGIEGNGPADPPTRPGYDNHLILQFETRQMCHGFSISASD